eukprot:12931748-Alexandrium_andersonii.AAC.1
MSASLVGSEMCIRDRASWGFDRPEDGGRVIRILGAARPYVVVSSPPCACLLYTSDAADDM